MSRYTDKLQLLLDTVYEGLHQVNLRLDFSSHSNISHVNNFTDLLGNPVYGEWWTDSGSLGVPTAERESRLNCRKGKATFTFTGPTCILRVFLNPDYGTADVRIDGVLPSSIAGAVDTRDTITCDSSAYGLSGEQPIDLVLADNLGAGSHTVELYCDNPLVGDGGYICLLGFKSRKSSLILEENAWLLPFGTPQNRNVLTVKNLSPVEARNVAITFPTHFVDDSGVALGTVSFAVFAAGQTETIPFTRAYNEATVLQGTEDNTIEVVAEYPDPLGSITYNIDYTVDSHNTTLLTDSGSWSRDQDLGKNRAYTDTAGNYVEMVFEGDQLSVEIERAWGWGKLNTLIDGNPSTQLDCGLSSGVRRYETVSVTVTGTGAHTLRLVNDTNDSAPFAKIVYTLPTLYSEVTENFIFRTTRKAVPPFPPKNVVKTVQGPDCDAVNPADEDLNLPCKNEGAIEKRVYYRVPTFVVYYGFGKEEIIREYDIAILDLHGISRKGVQRLQAKGVKVLLYISMGEEDSTRADPYDSSSAAVPYIGDGLGPGGYASYYAKGGNYFCESSECMFDRQSREGVKACAKSRGEYLTDPGRCGKACQNDSRLGYDDYRVGGTCSKGYTRENNWYRTSNRACQNAACADYSPTNSKCPLWEEGHNPWGQDFSIFTPDFPDQNGTWGSCYIDVTKPSWKQRLIDYYFKVCFDAGEVHTQEAHTVSLYNDGRKDNWVCLVDHLPVDFEEPIIVENSTGHQYIEHEEFTYSARLGAFLVYPKITSPQLVAGDTIKITYTRAGLQADGVFMDTVDTVDIYPSDAYKAAFVQLIADMKALYPTKEFCSNRGFAILDDIIQYCQYVMFETFLTTYDWNTGIYSIITDQGEIDWNNSVIENMKTLRESHVFDVLALNYCTPGPAGDAMREYVHTTARALGFLSAAAEKLLNDPPANTPFETTDPSVPALFRTNAWRQARGKPIS